MLTKWRKRLFKNAPLITWAYWLILVGFFFIVLRKLGAAYGWSEWLGKAIPLPSGWAYLLASGLIKRLIDLFIKVVFGLDIATVIRKRLLPVNRDLTDDQLKRITHYVEAADSINRDEVTEEELFQDYSLFVPLKAKNESFLLDSSDLPDHMEDVLDAIDSCYLLSDKPLLPLVLQGDPGAGKSTLIFQVFRIACERLKALGHGWIPLIVFVRQLSLQDVQSCGTIKELLIKYFERMRPKGRGFAEMSDFLNTHFGKYRFLIIFDGLDEFQDRKAYEEMAVSLDALLNPRSKHQQRPGAGYEFQGKNRYIVSCRTEDNQGKIGGTLITLESLAWERVMKYLRRRRQYTANNRHITREARKEAIKRIEGMIAGLEESHENGLLRNYVANPYLLTLIVRYYTYPQRELATTLKQVFDDVLKRELMKTEVSSKSHHLANYVVRLLAPYVYLTATSSIEGVDREVDFLQALRAEPELSTVLFGDDTHGGYLQAVFSNDLELEMKLQTKLLKQLDWNESEVDTLRSLLKASKTATIPFSEFKESVAISIKEHLFNVLKRSNLAVLDVNGQKIDHFRHRRLQDYFVALHIDRVGIRNCPHIQRHLANAWFREPLRIYAAIGRMPEDLLAECVTCFDFIMSRGAADVFKRLNNAANLLINASSAIAFLPSPMEEPPRPALMDIVLIIGQKTHRLYHYVGLREVIDATGSEGDMLRRKCLECFRNVYSSEFLSTKIADPAMIFGTVYQTREKRAINSWVSIHNGILGEGGSYQQLSYKCLYPIRDNHPRFPISRFSLSLYVIDVVLLFRRKYLELISTTHANWGPRTAIWLAFRTRQVLGVALLLLVVLLGPAVFGWAVLLTLLGFVCLGMCLATQWYIRKGVVGTWSEAPVAMPYFILRLAKRLFIAIIRSPDMLIELVPLEMSVPPGHVATSGAVGSDNIDLRAQRHLAKDKSPGKPGPTTLTSTKPSPAVRGRRIAFWITWAIAVSALYFPIRYISKVVIESVNVFDLVRKTSTHEKQSVDLNIEATREIANGAQKPELENLHNRLTSENEQIDELLADALRTEAPAVLARRYLQPTMSQLTSLKERVNSLESRISESLVQEDNSAAWNELNESVESLRDTIVSLQQPRPAASTNEMESFLRVDESLRSQLQNLRANAESFTNRLLRGGRKADLIPVREALNSLDKLETDYHSQLVAYERVAQVREAASEFLNKIPALLGEVRDNERTSPENLNLRMLRTYINSATQLQNRLEESLDEGRRLQDGSLSPITRIAVGQATKRLEVAHASFSERILSLQRKLTSAELQDEIPILVRTIDGLVSDVKLLRTTAYKDPKDALSVISQLRRHLDEANNRADAIRVQAEDPSQSETVDRATSKLQQAFIDLQAIERKWSVRQDAKEKREALIALQGHMKEILDTKSTEDPESRIREINWVQEAFDQLGHPAELSVQMKKIQRVREALARNLPPQGSGLPLPNTPSKRDALVEARCENLTQNYDIDDQQAKDLHAFLAQDAAGFVDEMARIMSGPRVRDLFLTYRRADQHLLRFRQIAAPLPSLKGAVSSFLAGASDISDNNHISDKCRTTLLPLIGSAKEIDRDIQTAEGLGRRIQDADFEQRLIGDKSQARKMAQSLATKVSTVSALLFLASLVGIGWGKYREKKGFVELKKLHTFDQMLEFVVTNEFPRDVNLKALAYLELEVKTRRSPNDLKALTDSAKDREKRGVGVLNDDVATRLRELARGLDNVLNRNLHEEDESKPENNTGSAEDDQKKSGKSPKTG